MNITPIRPADVVECDVRGRRFLALVEAKGQAGGLVVQPITHGITYRTVTSRQVVTHFRRSRAGRARAERDSESKDADA